MLNYLMGTIFVGIRDVDEEAFRRFKAQAIERKLALGKALSEAMREAVKKRKHKENIERNKVLLEVSPFKFPLGNERLSNQIDTILYGGS